MGESEDEQRRTRKIWKMPGLSIQRPDRSRNQDPCGPDTETRTAGPGEPTSEPATLQEKRGQARVFLLSTVHFLSLFVLPSGCVSSDIR
ncbi:hypothetical protein NDU88_010524 [Pleurodeles waltl]|uniref:Uncharacterized protein n=1 Tax=Pleurodeles waltl TaxID=8319 RepID=A0AAV7PYM0_PLEWA|nr:hypothetical protein NDU88_010524 [Pleurodeles waltl]